MVKKEEFFENSLIKNEHDEENNSYLKKQEIKYESDDETKILLKKIKNRNLR